MVEEPLSLMLLSYIEHRDLLGYQCCYVGCFAVGFDHMWVTRVINVWLLLCPVSLQMECLKGV